MYLEIRDLKNFIDSRTYTLQKQVSNSALGFIFYNIHSYFDLIDVYLFQISVSNKLFMVNYENL